MHESLTIDPSRTAVLIMDFQVDIVATYASTDGTLLARAASVLETAREAAIPIVYVKVGFRPGYPEVSPRNARFSKIKESGFLSGRGADIHPAVAPRPDDIVVVKHRVNAFAGTDLDLILRANTIDTLILFGIATSGVVLSTVRHAADADYRLVVVSDCCADRSPRVHECLIEDVFPTQATVVKAADLLEALPAQPRH